MQGFRPLGGAHAAVPGALDATYGATPGLGAWGAAPAGKPSFGKRHRPINLVGLLACLFVPVLTFAVVFSLQSFSLHYNNAFMCAVLNFIVLGMVLGLGVIAATAWRRRHDGMQDPKWYTFIFATALLAWIFAFVFGKMNFVANIAPYLDIVNLNVYPSVDPAKYRGQQLMDAGRIIFTPESHLDLKLSMGFKNLHTYCVAPITSPNQERNASGDSLPIYDFWAVGINCCSGHAPDFHCGEFNNENAKSGLRLMREDHRAYYRLAVQQAEAAYKIRSPHPVFLTWMQDPMSEVSAYQDDGYRFWLIGMGGFFVFQLILVVAAAVTFSKLGV